MTAWPFIALGLLAGFACHGVLALMATQAPTMPADVRGLLVALLVIGAGFTVIAGLVRR